MGKWPRLDTGPGAGFSLDSGAVGARARTLIPEIPCPVHHACSALSQVEGNALPCHATPRMLPAYSTLPRGIFDTGQIPIANCQFGILGRTSSCVTHCPRAGGRRARAASRKWLPHITSTRADLVPQLPEPGTSQVHYCTAVSLMSPPTSPLLRSGRQWHDARNS